MADTFKKDDAGIRRLLQSAGCMSVIKKYAEQNKTSNYMKPFIGFDRAKVFVYKEK